jgi:sRNA-binding carbon storage regulator CsrA
MLVLSRKIGDRIVVPNSELVITLLAIEDKTIRLDISALAGVVEHPDEDWHQLFQRKTNGGLPPQSETDRFRTLLDRSDFS